MTALNQNAARASGTYSPVPTWLTTLLAVTMVFMASQLRLPIAGGKLAFADIALAASMAGILYHLWRTGERIAYAASLVLVLMLYCLSALVGRAGCAGGIESIQRIEQFLCGCLVIGFFIERRRDLLIRMILLGLGINLLVAMIHAMKYGFGSALAPADVLALPWGFGRAYSGLFRGRVALSFYLGMTVLWLFPFLVDRAKSTKHMLLASLGIALTLGFSAHGGLLVLTCGVLFVVALIHSRRAVGIAGLALLFLAMSLSGRRQQTLNSTLSPFKEGQGVIKTCHADLVAAMRMARIRPIRGIGPGRYQEFIGSCYGELPNPNYNDIEADTQSGLGILLSTAGYPAGLALIIAILVGAVAGLRRTVRQSETDPLVLGGTGSLALGLGGMLVSDPMTLGLAWFLCLGFTSVYLGHQRGIVRLTWFRILFLGAMLGAMGILTALVPKGDPMARRALVSMRPDTPLRPTASSTGPAVSPTVFLNSSTSGTDIFRVLDAGDATEITAPAVKTTDSQASKQTIIHIPDGKGKPPEGKDPGLEYGGARFEVELPSPMICRIWVRVWWEGSCGNTMYFKTSPDMPPVTVGNDGTYDAWHWLEVQGKHQLKQGKNEILLLNREDGVRFDQMLITNDMEYYPQGIEEE